MVRNVDGKIAYIHGYIGYKPNTIAASQWPSPVSLD